MTAKKQQRKKQKAQIPTIRDLSPEKDLKGGWGLGGTTPTNPPPPPPVG